MNQSWHYIRQKSGSIQYALLRFHDKKGNIILQVKTTPNEDEVINCIISGPIDTKKWVNKNVNIIQKKNDDYLYITGKVSDEVINGPKIISVRVLKACWFVKKNLGHLSWLEEKYIYDRSEAIKSATA